MVRIGTERRGPFPVIHTPVTMSPCFKPDQLPSVTRTPSLQCYGRAPGSTDAPASSWELTLLDDEPELIARQNEALWTAFQWKARPRMITPPALLDR